MPTFHVWVESTATAEPDQPNSAGQRCGVCSHHFTVGERIYRTQELGPYICSNHDVV